MVLARSRFNRGMRRRGPYRKRFNRRRSNKRMKKFAYRIERLIGEKKYYITNSGGNFSVSNAGTVTHLTAVPLGDTDQSRDGDQLTIRSLELKWQAIAGYTSSTTTYDFYNRVRCVVFQWFPQTVPVIADILISTGNGYHIAPYNHDTRFQFKVLYDSTRTVDQTFFFNGATTYGVSTGNSQSQLITKHINRGYKNRRVQYVAGTTTAPSFGLYLLFVSDSSAVTHPQAEYVAKLNYSDN